MKQPSVSIIIPCFNDGRYLPEAVASAFASDYPAFEVLLVDDGSTDPGTLATIKAITRQYPPLHLITHTRNTGLAAARNAGIRAATGEWILPLDSDDRLMPDALRHSICAAAHDDRIGVVYGSVRYFGIMEKIWTPPEVTPASLLDFNHICACSLFRKQAWQDCGGYEESLFRQSWEDWDFWLSLLEQGWRFRRIPDVMLEYRQRPDSLSRCTQDKDVRQKLYQQIFRRHQTLYQAELEPMLLLKAERDWVIHDQQAYIQKLEKELSEALKLQRDIRWLLALRDGAKRLLRWPKRKPCL